MGVDLQRARGVAVAAAQAAGAVIRGAWGTGGAGKGVQHKGAMDLVTETDRRCEELIFEQLKGAFPDHRFVGEEETAQLGAVPALTAAPTWLVDPLDGTTNFVHNFPFTCVCIGLAVEREVALGVVYNPVLDELFVGVRGAGATLNGEPIRVSDTGRLSSALVATELGVHRDRETMDATFRRVQALAGGARSLRCSGSCACNMTSVACGRLDAFYEIGFGGPWDCAAAAVIVREAGGEGLDPEGEAFDVMSRRVLATNGKLSAEVATILKGAGTAASEPQAPGPRAETQQAG